MVDIEHWPYTDDPAADVRRAHTIEDLDAQCKATEPIDLPGDRESFGRIPSPMSCRSAREYMRRDFPFERPRQIERSRRMSDLEAHFTGCEECTRWLEQGAPFLFDASWRYHREMLCNLIIETFRHWDEWPLTLEAAIRHAEWCESCAEWHGHRMITQSCEDVRKLLSKTLLGWSDSLGVDWPNEPISLISEHLDGCIGCREWCYASVDCGDVQKRLQGVYNYNQNEGRPHLKIAPGLLVRSHLSMCAGCITWARSNIERDWDSVDIYSAFEDVTDLEKDEAEAYANLAEGFSRLLSGEATIDDLLEE